MPRLARFRLFTTMVEPEEVTAELAAAYAQRWESESVFDELKTRRRGAKIVLRSKSPALVEQEIWGHPCYHYAIRALMFDSSLDAGNSWHLLRRLVLFPETFSLSVPCVIP